MLPSGFEPESTAREAVMIDRTTLWEQKTKCFYPPEETCIIVLDVSGKLMGAIVDTVSEVLDVVGEQIEPTPDFGSKLDTEYILGMGKIGDKVKILLDIDKVLATEELHV